MKSYHIRCPKCNNNHSFYRYGKDSSGYQKYLCRNCHHQFAPKRLRSEGANCRRKHPPCPVCGKASFLHHDYEHYSNYRCTDKKCNHYFFCTEVRYCYRSVYVNPFRQAQFQAYALSRSNYHHCFVNVLSRQEFISEYQSNT